MLRLGLGHKNTAPLPKVAFREGRYLFVLKQICVVSTACHCRRMLRTYHSTYVRQKSTRAVLVHINGTIDTTRIKGETVTLATDLLDVLKKYGVNMTVISMMSDSDTLTIEVPVLDKDGNYVVQDLDFLTTFIELPLNATEKVLK